ncbi:hypothetical protein AgCh_025644 [Apium graveolens]
MPSKFLQIASTIEQFGDLEKMTVEEAIGSLKAYEERLKGTTEVIGNHVLLTEEEWRKRENSDNKLLLTREEWQKRMNRGGNEGRPNSGGCNVRDKSRIRCYNCHIYGHYAVECRKPKREREARQEALMVQMEEKEPALLLEKHDNKCEEVMLNQRGVKPKVMTDERGIKASSNVCNIISLGQFSEEGKEVILKGDYIWVFEKQGGLLMKVKRYENRLYKLLAETEGQMCLLSKSDELTNFWHISLGHVNYLSLAVMHKHNMVYGLPNMSQLKEVCRVCLTSKQTRRAFPQKATFSATMALQLVHGDLCGPIEPTTLGGNKYMFLLVDDYSRVMWAYMLKSKDEAFSAFKKFRAQVEDGEKKRIKVFRTDREGEFISNKFKAY